MNTTPEDNSETNKKPVPRRKGLLVVAVIIVAVIFLSRRTAVETIDCTPDIIADNPDVIMLGAWWCSYCYQAKKYFQKNNIHYCEYDMESTDIGKRMYQEQGAGAIPKLLIGEYQVSGFNQRQIERALEILHSADVDKR